MDFENKIKSILKNEYLDIKLISDSNNKVYKITLKNDENLYAKFYLNNSSHIDNELKIYDLVDYKYLKPLFYKEKEFAIFKEVKGKTIDELNELELESKSKDIIESLCEFFNQINLRKVNKFGILDSELNGKFDTFEEFLIKRQNETSIELKDYPKLSNIFNLMFAKYKNIIKSDNSLVPIDTNLKNIMLLDDGTVKFIDPGEMISGPILMGYGDFVAHTYKTKLYDDLIERLSLTEEEMKLIRIYAICSSLNILAFLHKLGVTNLEEVIPYGNKYTFFELIKEHLKYLDI